MSFSKKNAYGLYINLYINLYIKKQHVFLLRNGDLYTTYTFQIKLSLKSTNQDFLFFFVNH